MKDYRWYKLASMSISDAYSVLGVAPGISSSDLQQAVRKLRKQWHPDVNKDPNALIKFQEIEQAAQLVLDDINGNSCYNPIDQPTQQEYPSILFSDPKLNELWSDIQANLGDPVSSVEVDPSKISNKIDMPKDVLGDKAYYNWEALFEDYDFAGLFDYTDDSMMNQVLLSKNGKLAASVYMGGIVDEIENEGLSEALNEFAITFDRMRDSGELSPNDLAALQSILGESRMDTDLLDNIMFDVFYPNNNIPDDVHFLQTSLTPPLPKGWNDYDGYMQFYIIPARISFEQFKVIFEYAQELNMLESFDYLIEYGIYISRDIYEVSAQDAYDWIQGWEEHLKRRDFNYMSVEEWYRKMSAFIAQDEAAKAKANAIEQSAHKYAELNESNKDFWDSLYWKVGNDLIRKQCFWCGGFIKPDETLVFPPGVSVPELNKSDKDEMAAMKKRVDSQIPPHVAAEGTISHTLCNDCFPYYAEWMTKGASTDIEENNIMFSKTAITKKDEASTLLNYVNDRMKMIKFKKIPTISPAEYGDNPYNWLRHYTTLVEESLIRKPRGQAYGMAMSYWEKFEGLKKMYEEETAGVPTQLNLDLFSGGKRTMVKTSMRKQIKNVVAGLETMGMEKIAQDVRQQQQVLNATDTLTKERLASMMESLKVAQSKLKTLQSIVSSSSLNAESLSEAQAEMGQLIVKIEQIYKALGAMYQEAFGEKIPTTDG